MCLKGVTASVFKILILVHWISGLSLTRTFGDMYILPSPVFFKGENPSSRGIGNLGWWECDKK